MEFCVMSKEAILLIGAGGHAHACVDALQSQRKYSIAGLLGTKTEIGSQRFGYSVLGSDDDLPRLIADCQYALIAVGHIKNADLRRHLYTRLLKLGFRLPIIVASTAYVSPHARVGAGSVVMHGAIVNAGAIIGDNSIINTRAVVEHDAKVGAHCHISTGAILNGDVRVGDGSFVGSGCTVKEGIAIGQNVLVGMGLSVRYSLEDGCRFVGSGKL
jgi:sugar O-acyltransferase (sialic acid O-acetyltransferase NeuD family)